MPARFLSTHSRRKSAFSSAASRSNQEGGFALVWATVTVMIIAGLLASASEKDRGLEELARAEFGSQGQAHGIARAGLEDAVAWFRRRPSQPVTVFEPQRDPRLPPPDAIATPESIAAAAAAYAADPPEDGEVLVNETEDPGTGIVRSFEISPGLWGRYTVFTGTDPEPFVDGDGDGVYDPGESYTDSNGDGRWSPGRWTRDVTVERGLGGNGTVWYIACRGEVYQRPNGDLPLGEGGNVRVAEAVLATEIRRLTIAPPAAATVVTARGDDIRVATRGRLRGDTCLAYPSSTGNPSTSGGEIYGSSSPVPAMDLSVEQVFGVSWAELRSMADISTSDATDGLPAVLPDFTLTVFTGNLTFNAARPLRGNGVLVVQGDVVIESGSNSFFRGLLYVDGELTMRAPSYTRGTVLATGDVDIRGTGGDFCEVEHDSGMVSLLLTHIGQYRHSKAVFVPQQRMLDGRPSDMDVSKRRFGGAP